MAQFPNLPDVVIYTEFGVEHKAFPIGSHELEHHFGEGGEPLLSLVFVKPVIDPVTHEPRRVHDSELVHIVHDVPHESHNFNPDQLKAMEKSGITAATVYPGGQIPGGRWRELDTPTPFGNLGSVAISVPEAAKNAPALASGGFSPQGDQTEVKVFDSETKDPKLIPASDQNPGTKDPGEEPPPTVQ